MPERIPASNAVRLSLPQWLRVTLFCVLFALVIPRLWTKFEAMTLVPDHRVPRELFEDYWSFERFVGRAASDHDVLVLGDSVIWGEWVNRHETLSHYLNAQTGTARFANLGLNGAHPLALEGLVENYATPLAHKKVVLHCNLLWLTTPKMDLQTTDAKFNHPRLVPQFVPHVPAYREEISPRLGVLVERRLAISQWANHLQQAYYRTDDRPSDIPGWTLKHPYADPLEPLRRPLPIPDDQRRADAASWQKRGLIERDYAWVDPDTSLQWPAFQRTVRMLQRRGSAVFVVVGPFNEHMLTATNQRRYQATLSGISSWLKTQQIPHMLPRVLASDLYADDNHPLAQGYEMLARQLLDDPAFRAFLN